MDRTNKSVKKENKNVLIKTILTISIVTFIVVFVIRGIIYNQITTTYRDDMVDDIEVMSQQFNHFMDTDIGILEDIAHNFVDELEFEGEKSEKTVDMMQYIESKSCFSEVYFLSIDGTLYDSELNYETVDKNAIADIFTADSVFAQCDAIVEDRLLLHTPIIENNIELIAVFDEEHIANVLNMFNKAERSRLLMFSAAEGNIVVDYTYGEFMDTGKNFYDVMENVRYHRGFNFMQMKSDLIMKRSGYTAYYMSEKNELHYTCYSPTKFGDWYVVQIIPDDIVVEVSRNLRVSITSILLFLVVLCIIISLFAVANNRKKYNENQEIKMQVEVAKLANEAKSEFLSNMSHDIRTPLNAIVGMAEICEMNADNPERVKECIDKQKAASEHLMTLINDVLEMSKIESGKAVYMNSEFKIGVSIHNIVMFVQQRMSNKNLRFTISPNTLVHEEVIGDEQRINRAILNIVSNAVKFTPDGGKISIKIDEKKADKPGYSTFVVEIKDTGIGMSEEFVKKIFIPFERVQDATVGQIEGAGLGMTIALNLIESIGGSISVESKIGAGTTVRVEFPLKVVEKEDISEEYIQVLENYKDNFVVVVDDNVNLIEWMDKLVLSLGMKCVTTTSATEALEVVKRMRVRDDKIALMIFGWKMPKMKGTELASKMREIVGNDVPIVLQTVYEFDEEDDTIRAAGINKVLVEPIFRSDLLELFDEMVNGGNDSTMKFPDFSGKRVLLVEDHIVNAGIISEYLRYTGLEVDIVYDGTEAVDKMQETPDDYYDLIFMDIRMPKMNGYDATREIRAMKSEYTHNLPIIALSANAFIEDRKKSKEVGMNGHLAKPVKYEELYNELKKWFSN